MSYRRSNNQVVSATDSDELNKVSEKVESPKEEIKNKEAKSVPGKGESILVAEDDSLYAKIYVRKLQNEGYKVTIAPNGEEAEKLLDENKYDLMLLDLIMPIKDGFEVLNDIKQGKVKNKPKTVVMSNLSQDDDIKKVMDMGAVDYFVKANISVGEMVDKVKKYL